MKKKVTLFIICNLIFLIILYCIYQPPKTIQTISSESKSDIKEADVGDIYYLLQKLEDKNADSANKAYLKLYLKGKTAIPYLISNGDNMNPFYGTRHINELSSLITEPPCVGVISLYIVECILNTPDLDLSLPLEYQLSFHPHLNAYIWDHDEDSFHEPPKTKAEVLRNAKKAYEVWWERNSTRTLKEIIELDRDPLKDTHLHWYGGL